MKKLFFYSFVFIFFFTKAQNEIQWKSSMNIAANTYSNMYPRTVMDRKGNPMVIWGRMSDQAVFFSKWNGTMFSTPIKLNPTSISVASANWMGPDIAAYGDTVYVVVKRTPETNDTNRIFIFTSFNGGVSFKAPVELAIIADSISRFPTVTTDATGNPLIAFMKFNASFMDSRWVVLKSSDYGNTFSKGVKASGWGSSAEVCDCCPGSIVSSGNKTVLLYRDNNNNIRDIWAGFSNNNASSFSSGFRVDSNNWMVNSCPSSGPDAVIIGDTLYTTFMSSASGKYRTYLSKSNLSSGTLGTVSNLTGSITGLSQQNYPRIASDGNAMAIVWKQTVNSIAQLPILFTNNITNGLPVNYDTVDLVDITNTDIAMSNGSIFVVWQDDNAGTVKFRQGTYNKAIISKLEEPALPFYNINPNPFNAETKIQIETPLTRAVLTIYDVSGTMVKQIKNISGQEIIIQRDNLPSGMYHIQIKQDNKTILENKLILE